MLSLLEIQKLQFGDKDRAESELSAFFAANQGRDIQHVTINTKPESLNSLNGIVTFASGEKYFFKTHVEENERLAEYYNANLLQEAGYPVLRPNRLETSPGQQLALYEIVTLPTLFDEIKQAEDECLAASNQLDDKSRTLIKLNDDLDKIVHSCHKETLDLAEKSTATAPIHQLFSHRLASDGRLSLFYKGKSLTLAEQVIPFEKLASLKWTINDTTYDDSLAECISRAQDLLNFERPVVSVVGHGDAHNGNVFVDYESKKLLYFDPAFAGRHDPILDLTKPIFHNVFARWMYFPEQVNAEFDISWKISDDRIEISHSYTPSKIREEILRSKLRHSLHPLLGHLAGKQRLPATWSQYLRSALMCCPLLTVNLLAASNSSGNLSEKYSEKIKLLGFIMSITAGSQSSKINQSDILQRMFAEIFEQ
jgi:hypothetical protein